MNTHAQPMPMFPLGSVLVPSQILPLHIFEDRYRVLMEHLMLDGRPEEEQEFGVCLIERGHEVGGEDQRSAVGTVARVLQAEKGADGRWAVIAVGVNRIRVEDWLDDDPYPLAMVSDWDDMTPVVEPGPVFEAVKTQHRRVLAMASEAGFDVGQLPEISDEPGLGSYQLVATAPISAFDRQRLLCAPGLDERLPMLSESLEAAMDFVEFELARGGESDG